jgi:hypothetical protein
VCAPLELSELEDLADLLDRPLQPLITPEYRWNLVYAHAYGLDPPARFTTLARSLDADPAPPVGRAPTIIVDERSGANGPGIDERSGANGPGIDERPTPPYAPAARLTPPAGVAADELARGRRHTIIGVVPNRAATDGVVVARASEDDTPPSGAIRRAIRASSQSGAQRISGPIAAIDDRGLPPVGSAAEGPRGLIDDRGLPPVGSAAEGRRGLIDASAAARTSGPVPVAVARTSGPVPTAGLGGLVRPAGESRPSMRALGPVPRPSPIATEGRDTPLPIVRARELLAAADDRDTVFLTLLRAARSRARWAGLLTVQGGAAIGRVALAESGIDITAINTVLIPLDTVSPFRTVVGNHQSHIGPLVSGDPSIDSMMLRMGGTMPPSALILPIVLRERVVAVVVAHRLDSDLRLVDVTELLPMATAASDAISRLIVKHKSAGYRPPTEAPIVEIDPEMIDTKRLSREIARRPSGAASVPGFEQGVEMSMEAGEPRPIDDVLGEIERAAEHQAEDAIAEAVERTSETVRALARRFPGKLRVDRFAVPGRPLPASQYSGLLELVVRLGSAASELLIDKLGSPQRDVRFYAAVCTAELRPRSAVAALAERLFDQDFGVRGSAIEALAGYPLQELGHALQRARRAAHSSDADVVAAATGALVALGDTEAIPDLIGVIERGDRGGEHARRALVALTAQDFGGNERKWRKWHDGARRRHRIEWLIEGLGHKEDAIRESAINVLRRLTGEYFGYHHDLPRKERDAAAEKWAAWWRDTGHRRFATVASASDGESPRTTGEVPIRRDS